MTQNKVQKRKISEPQSRREYTLDEKAKALTILELNGGNLTRTAKQTGIHFNTLRKWRDTTDPIVAQAHKAESRNLSQLFENEILGIMTALPLARGSASYSQLAGGLTVLFDRWRLLNNLPTEITDLIPPLIAASKGANVDLVQLLKSTLARLNQMAEQRFKEEMNDSKPLLNDPNTVTVSVEEVSKHDNESDET